MAPQKLCLTVGSSPSNESFFYSKQILKVIAALFSVKQSKNFAKNSVKVFLLNEAPSAADGVTSPE